MPLTLVCLASAGLELMTASCETATLSDADELSATFEEDGLRLTPVNSTGAVFAAANVGLAVARLGAAV